MLRIPIFKDRDQNEIIIPGLWYDSDNPEHDPIRTTMDAMMYSVALNLKTEWRDFEVQGDTVPLPHHEADITHPGFAHGGARVLLIGGPEFEARNANPHQG